MSKVRSRIEEAVQEMGELTARSFDTGIVLSAHVLACEGHTKAAEYLLSQKEQLLKDFKEGGRKYESKENKDNAEECVGRG